MLLFCRCCKWHHGTSLCTLHFHADRPFITNKALSSQVFLITARFQRHLQDQGGGNDWRQVQWSKLQEVALLPGWAGTISWSWWGASPGVSEGLQGHVRSQRPGPELLTPWLLFPFSLILVLVTHDFGCFRVIGYFLPEIHKNNILIIKGINNKMIWIKIKMDPFQHLLYFQFELWINDGISPKEYILLSGNSPENHQDLNYKCY